jgi:hypothetical protein
MFSIPHIIHHCILLCAKTFKPWIYVLSIIFTRANLAKQYIKFDSQLNLVQKKSSILYKVNLLMLPQLKSSKKISLIFFFFAHS